MSTEKIISTGMSDLPTSMTQKNTEEVSLSGRVDINILLNRARKEKEKETRTSLIFSGLALAIIFIVGLILTF